MKSVGVFLSSSNSVSSLIQAEAFRLGQALGEREFKIVYGGAECGSMGALAQGVLSKKGHLIGVIPEIDILTEVVQKDLTEKVLVQTMGQRKDRIIELSDAFIAFPGGIGTLDEITDVLCAKSLKSTLVNDKPLLFYNYMDFWTPFLESLQMMAQQRMISTPLDQLYQVFETLEDVVGYLK